MREKGLLEYDLQLVNRASVKSGGQLIESNVESLDKKKRIEQRG